MSLCELGATPSWHTYVLCLMKKLAALLWHDWWFDPTGTAWVHLKASEMHTQLLFRSMNPQPGKSPHWSAFVNHLLSTVLLLHCMVLCYGNPRKTITTAFLKFVVHLVSQIATQHNNWIMPSVTVAVSTYAQHIWTHECSLLVLSSCKIIYSDVTQLLNEFLFFDLWESLHLARVWFPPQPLPPVHP